jgi:Holliday junction DNA helicase RuvB
MISGAEQFLQDLLDRVREPEHNVFDPETFDEFVGQDDVKKVLRIIIEASLIEGRPLPNILLEGGYGLGKTTLAKLIFKEYGRDPLLLDGSTVNTSLPQSGMVIIDEIHNITSETADRLHAPLDSGRLHIIGCTTDPGKLPSAFRSRFRAFNLTNYTNEQLTEIAQRVCERKGVTADRSVLYLIASRSRFNARSLTQINLSMIFDLLAVRQTGMVTREIAIETFNMLGLDERGYSKRDRQYVSRLPDRPIGLDSLSAALGISKTTIQEEIEPFLLQTGVIDITPRGRIKLKEI